MVYDFSTNVGYWPYLAGATEDIVWNIEMDQKDLMIDTRSWSSYKKSLNQVNEHMQISILYFTV